MAMSDDIKKTAIEIGADILEVAADQLLSDGILKDIPVFGTAVKLAGIGKTINDRIFLAKVHKFIFALPKIDQNQRRMFAHNMSVDEKLRQKLGETIILILDRFEDLEKPEILAKIFAALINEKINLEQFRRLANAVDLAFVDDLKKFSAMTQHTYMERDEFYYGLLRTGLIDTNTASSYEIKQAAMFSRDPEFRFSNVGSLFHKIMNDEL
jgi:hypothetical protein